MKLHRDLGVTQKTAWHLAHRIRETWERSQGNLFTGAVEIDETYVGGKKKKEIKGRGPVGKAVVAGVKDRESKQVVARVIENTRKATLHGFVNETTDTEKATVYTDDLKSYNGVAEKHQTVAHSAGEYVNGMIHTNGIESFWSMLKRGYKGTYHKMSVKHLDRYVTEFSGCHNDRDNDTIDQMASMVRGMSGKQLRYKDLQVSSSGLIRGG